MRSSSFPPMNRSLLSGWSHQSPARQNGRDRDVHTSVRQLLVLQHEKRFSLLFALRISSRSVRLASPQASDGGYSIKQLQASALPTGTGQLSGHDGRDARRPPFLYGIHTDTVCKDPIIQNYVAAKIGHRRDIQRDKSGRKSVRYSCSGLQSNGTTLDGNVKEPAACGSIR
jgi:hypothetical protein